MPSDPVTLADLFVRRIKTDDIGPYREHDGFQITEAQLIQVLEGMEATERINWCVPHARGAYLMDGVIECESIIYSPCQGTHALVLPLPTPKDSES